MENDEATSQFKGRTLLVEMVAKQDWKGLDAAIKSALPKVDPWCSVSERKRMAQELEDEDCTAEPESSAIPATTLPIVEPATKTKEARKRRRFTEAESNIIRLNWQTLSMADIASRCNGIFLFLFLF